jgi:predicted XRE-type DNA-binding protein
MRWGKDPEKRTKFGVWLDKKEIFQTEVAKASGLDDSAISRLCNKHSSKPTYLVFRKLRSGLEEMGYQVRYEDFW